MAQYIDKATLVAEIEKRKKSLSKRREDMRNLQCYTLADDVLIRMGELYSIQDFLNTLEVKEVDLEKEIKEQSDKYYSQCEKKLQEMDDNDKDLSFLSLDNFAKHFFELGVSCQANNISMEEVKTAAKAWSEDEENTRGCDYIGAVVAERAFVACAEWLINKAQKG